MIPKSLKRGEESTSTPPPGCLVEIFGSCRHEWDRGFESGLLQRRVVRTPVPTSKRPAFKGEDKSPTPFIMPERVRRPVPTPAEDQSDILPLPFVPTIGLQSKAYSSRNNATLRISPSPAGPSRTLPGPIIARIEGSDPRDSRSNHSRRPIVPPVSPIIPCQIV